MVRRETRRRGKLEGEGEMVKGERRIREPERGRRETERLSGEMRESNERGRGRESERKNEIFNGSGCEIQTVIISVLHTVISL